MLFSIPAFAGKTTTRSIIAQNITLANADIYSNPIDISNTDVLTFYVDADTLHGPVSFSLNLTAYYRFSNQVAGAVILASADSLVIGSDSLLTVTAYSPTIFTVPDSVLSAVLAKSPEVKLWIDTGQDTTTTKISIYTIKIDN